MLTPIQYLTLRLAKAGGPVERANLVEMMTLYAKREDDKEAHDNEVASAEGVAAFLKPKS